MKVAACQLPYVWKDPARALSLIHLHALDAERQGAQLVCFPECFLQGYDVSPAHVAGVAVDLGAPEFESLLRRLEGVEPVVVVGLIEKEGEEFFNTAVVVARGALLTRYRKVHLSDGEQRIFQPGKDAAVFEVGGLEVGINICGDLRFAESVQSAVAAGAELLACPCNNLLRPASAEAWKLRHNEIRCERARGARVWILSSDIVGEHDGRISYGPTALIDPEGKVVDQVPLMTTGMLVADVSRPQPR